ncbi:CAP domain-containing protein [Glycomyces sp. NRRL B-16210]|uniref:CAP domain-containing protein n=1 Tax=Glycomyces sp. NRRL B-16210 TaxID=1463821 RepID=UPI00068CD796|nr:CAP domain-containing protein [Glycomyces sp. NRRL B-16210]
MRRLQGGRHRDPAESRRRMFLAILTTFALAAAAMSLWALDSPLEGEPASAERETPAVEVATPVLAELQIDEAAIRPQEPEEAPTTEAPETTPPAQDDDEDSGGSGGGDSGGGNGGGGGGDSAPYASAEAAVLDIVNRNRSDAGCGALSRDGKLDTAARLHAEDMAVNDYFSHTSLDGRSPTERASQQGYQGGVGENIAYGYRDAEAVMEGWMNSEGHRANILNCGYDVIGIGVADRNGTLYWVQNFG